MPISQEPCVNMNWWWPFYLSTYETVDWGHGKRHTFTRVGIHTRWSQQTQQQSSDRNQSLTNWQWWDEQWLFILVSLFHAYEEVCACAAVYTCAWINEWMPGVNFGFLSLLLFTLCFETVPDWTGYTSVPKRSISLPASPPPPLVLDAHRQA